MLPAERQDAILTYLVSYGYASVIKLSEVFSVSEMTIRRDLNDLEKRGLVQRTYGGAKAHIGQTPKSSFENRIQRFVAEKRRIGQAAADLIQDEETIFIDAGSTTYQMLPYIAKKRIKVITNSLSIAVELANYPQIETVVTGGILRKTMLSMVGPPTETFLQAIHVDKLFLGVDGVDLERGLSVTNMLDAHTKKHMIACADYTVVLADHSKLNTVSLATFARLNEVDLLIIDNGTDSHILEALRERIAVLVT